MGTTVAAEAAEAEVVVCGIGGAVAPSTAAVGGGESKKR